jgi:hypothetical protein
MAGGKSRRGHGYPPSTREASRTRPARHRRFSSGLRRRPCRILRRLDCYTRGPQSDGSA